VDLDCGPGNADRAVRPAKSLRLATGENDGG
jgi:hypothetical protein